LFPGKKNNEWEEFGYCLYDYAYARWQQLCLNGKQIACGLPEVEAVDFVVSVLF
jgi:hypothetical protein